MKQEDVHNMYQNIHRKGKGTEKRHFFFFFDKSVPRELKPHVTMAKSTQSPDSRRDRDIRMCRICRFQGLVIYK